MQGPLAFCLNDDGTVTLRCDADAFFAHADEIRRLLTGGPGDDESEEAGPPPASAEPEGLPGAAADSYELGAFWEKVFPSSGTTQLSRDLSRHGLEVLAAGYYLTRERGFEAFSRKDLEAALASAPVRARADRALKTGTLIHLARKGWLERVRRGAYRLSRRALDRVKSMRRLDALPPPSQVPVPAPPSLVGLSRFLREVPANRKWRRVLLVAYFLHEHGETKEFDRRLLAACFQRLRGIDTPGSLAALISQVLHKRHGLLERGSRRGLYRLTPSALEDLRRNPRVAKADAVHRAQGLEGVTKTAS